MIADNLSMLNEVRESANVKRLDRACDTGATPRVAVFGLGYVGLTTAACLTKQGYRVCGVDVDRKKVDMVRRGASPIQEPGVEELLSDGVQRQLLTATIDAGDAVCDSDVIMVCVGTPITPDGDHNMEHVVNVTREIGNYLRSSPSRELTLVFRSTFKPGTMDGLIIPILKSKVEHKKLKDIDIVYNPEFLRESTAIADYFSPPRIVVGLDQGGSSSRVDQLYSDIVAPTFYTSYGEAEFIKLIDNTWHAAKVAFANEIGRIAAKLELNPQRIYELFIADTKLNISATYLRPGGPFGGSCLPKDVKALQHIASDVGASSHLINSITHSNEAHKYFLFEKCTRGIEPGARVLMLGLAFKNGSDDLRQSPYVDLARRLMDAGYHLSIYDAYLKPDQLIGQNLGYSALHLPDLNTLIVDRNEAKAGDYALVIDTNGTAPELGTRTRTVVSLHAL